MNPRGTQSSSWRRKLRHTKHWPCSCQKKKSRSICERETEKVSFAQRTTRKGCETPRSSYVNSENQSRMTDYTTDTNAAQPDRLGCWARGWGSPKSTKGLKRTHDCGCNQAITRFDHPLGSSAVWADRISWCAVSLRPILEPRVDLGNPKRRREVSP
jgi:hypothetical protein